MAQEQENSFEKLAQLIAKGKDADEDELEAAYAGIVREAVRAIHGKDLVRVGVLYNRLCAVYVSITIPCRDRREAESVFHFGRVVGLMDLLDEVRCVGAPTDIHTLLDESDYLELLAGIRMGPRTLKEHGRISGRDTNNVTRRVTHMANLGLVTTQPSGKDVVVTITPLGTQALNGKLPLFVRRRPISAIR